MSWPRPPGRRPPGRGILLEIGGLVLLLVLIAVHFAWLMGGESGADTGARDDAAVQGFAAEPLSLESPSREPLSREPLSDEGLLSAFDAMGIDVTASAFEVTNCGTAGLYIADHSDERDRARISLAIPTTALWPDPQSSLGGFCKYASGHIALEPGTFAAAANSPYLRGLGSSSAVDPARMILVDVYPMTQARFRRTVELIRRNLQFRCAEGEIVETSAHAVFSCRPSTAAFHFSGLLMAAVASAERQYLAADGSWIAACSPARGEKIGGVCELWSWQDGAALRTRLPADGPDAIDALRRTIWTTVSAWVN